MSDEIFGPLYSGPTVSIPVKVVGGEIREKTGAPLPRLREGAVGDLVMPEWAIENREMLDKLRRPGEVKLLPKDSLLWVHLAQGQDLPLALAVPRGAPGPVSPIVLEQDLLLSVHGSQRSFLVDAQCELLALREKAKSVNHAYTLLSERFEPGRRSHTGNVFRRVYHYAVVSGWTSLDFLRLGALLAFERDSQAAAKLDG